MSLDIWSSRRKVLRARLRMRRRQLGLGQKQIASRLDHLGMPISLKTVSTLELGAVVTVERLPILAMALECSVPYLLGMTGDPHAWEPSASTADQPRARHLTALPDPRGAGPQCPAEVGTGPTHGHAPLPFR